MSSVILQLICGGLVLSGFVYTGLQRRSFWFTFASDQITTGVYVFLKRIMKMNLYNLVWVPLIFLVFHIILFFNLVGLLPFTTTVFAQIAATLSLSTLLYLGSLISYASRRKLSALHLFFPAGTPLFIAPLLLVMEIISVFSRMISLSVRLFANLTAGHILLKILSTFFLLLVTSTNTFFTLAGMPLLIVIVLMTGLETIISVLQTYVYITLVLLYMHELESDH